MRIVQPYKQLNKLVQKEAFEPDVSWGLRMAIAAMVPLVWGVYADKLIEAGWIALIAECICWVELKGDFQHRLKLLSGSSVLALFFAMLGSISGNYIWLTVILMVGVGFISSLLKNIGNRGTGLSICVFALFIFCNAYPISSTVELQERFVLLLIGVAWTAITGLVASLFIPAQRPYRRSVATIWKSVAVLTGTISKGWDSAGPRSNEHDIYLKEKEIRAAIDESLELFEKLAHESNETDGHEYILAHARKAAALTGVQLLTITEELRDVDRKKLGSDTRIKIYTLLRAIEQTLERLAVFTITAEREEELVLLSRFNRIYKLTDLLKNVVAKVDNDDAQNLQRFVMQAERSTKLMEAAFRQLRGIVNERSMVRSYSMMKTIYILHPKYWVLYIQMLFNFNTFTFRYAVRSAIAAGFAMFIYKFWDIDHGYWIPFTLIIVMQTYFGATWTKARDRIIGTVAGGVVAGLFLRLPTGLYLQEALLFATFVPMIIYVRRRYSVAAFFMTVNLVLLFNINRELDDMLIITRALSTIAGSAIAIVAGFVLLPTWDKKWLPIHVADAINANYEYFVSVFYKKAAQGDWSKCKRKAESANSNAFDSFSRYMDEPSIRKRPFAIFYYIITHNIRVTRELNTIQSIGDEAGGTVKRLPKTKLIQECDLWFKKNLLLIKRLNSKGDYNTDDNNDLVELQNLTEQQDIYLSKMLVELKAMNTDLEKLVEKLPRIMQL